MNKTTIAIAGIGGSFSEEAVLKYLSQHRLEGEIIFATTAEQTFIEVVEGRALYGLVPIENSVGGMVYETIYAMAKHIFNIDEILQIDVQQNLLALPGTKLAEITHVASHPQALAQCRHYLKRHWEAAELEEYADTALAAQDLAAGKLGKTTAVIASRAAAKLLNLEILEPSIQDLKFNITAFLVFTSDRKHIG